MEHAGWSRCSHCAPVHPAWQMQRPWTSSQMPNPPQFSVHLVDGIVLPRGDERAARRTNATPIELYAQLCIYTVVRWATCRGLSPSRVPNFFKFVA
eukprot:2470489-Prymnesium_polylepis.2